MLIFIQENEKLTFNHDYLVPEIRVNFRPPLFQKLYQTNPRFHRSDFSCDIKGINATSVVGSYLLVLGSFLEVHITFRQD